MHLWILIQASEDGNPVSYLTTRDVEELLQDPAAYGVRKFLSEVPQEKDANYWQRGEALLFHAELISPPMPVEQSCKSVPCPPFEDATLKISTTSIAEQEAYNHFGRQDTRTTEITEEDAEILRSGQFRRRLTAVRDVWQDRINGEQDSALRGIFDRILADIDRILDESR